MKDLEHLKNREEEILEEESDPRVIEILHRIAPVTLGDIGIGEPFNPKLSPIALAKLLAEYLPEKELTDAEILADMMAAYCPPSPDRAEKPDYSHYHCWDQGKAPACGQPLEKHTQCCLCPVTYSDTEKKCETDGKSVWCYCGKCSAQSYTLPTDFLTVEPKDFRDLKYEVNVKVEPECCGGCRGDILGEREDCICHFPTPQPVEEKSAYKKVLDAMDTPMDSELELLDALCEEMKQKGRKQAFEEVREMIENYFSGLILILDPQATKTKLLTKLDEL